MKFIDFIMALEVDVKRLILIDYSLLNKTVNWKIIEYLIEL